ncbi:major facilitator superfamily domain-containing protein [Lipomyces kononenkoae]|uniref:Major facilitator superfamily domain-containing protein n=1 Tax=Lipomyces kononenkoae TaxID=34357 RepID=A0ACC3TBJ1_LIPKO
MPQYLDVPVSKRLLQISCAFIWCLTAAGPIFGFAALKTVWLREGVYMDRCTPEENDMGFVCSAREIRINFVFTCASVVTNIAGVIVGTILDKYGPQICGYIGGVLIAVGALMLAFADTISLLDLYVWGYIILAFGGPFVFISSFHLSNAFPAYSGFILALLTGAFDSSTGVYLVYRLIYDETNGHFHPKAFFLLYLIIPIFIIIASATVMPRDSYKSGGSISNFDEEDADLDLVDARSIVGLDVDSRTGSVDSLRKTAAVVAGQFEDPLLSEQAALLSDGERRLDRKDVHEYNAEEMAKFRISGVWGVLHGRTALQQIRTPWFMLLCLFTMIQMLRLNYFVATIRAQYDFIFHSPDIASRINEVFDIALPVGGVITVPIAGYLLDHYSMAVALGVLLGMGTTMGILGNFASIIAAYGNIGIFVIYRSLFYTAASDYSAKVFGFETFGKVYGLIATISGVFNFAQSAFDHLTHEVLGRDPRPVNIGLLILSTSIGSLWVWYVASQTKKIKRSALEAEAQRAVVVRMPGYAASEY